MANLCREAALGPIRSITDIQCIDADQVFILNSFVFARGGTWSPLPQPFCWLFWFFVIVEQQPNTRAKLQVASPRQGLERAV